MRDMMITIMLLLGITTAVSSYAQEMRVKEVKGKEVLIEDKATGREMRAQEGEDIGDGWKVTSVTENMVTIEKEIAPREKVRGQLPVGGGKKIEAR